MGVFGVVAVIRILQIERLVGGFYPVGSPSWWRRWVRRE